jgi:hypothetical protein
MFWEESPKESGAVQICVVKVGEPIKMWLRNSNTIPCKHECDTSPTGRGVHRILLGLTVIVESYEKLQRTHTPHTGVVPPVRHTPQWRGGWRISVTSGSIFPITAF